MVFLAWIYIRRTSDVVLNYYITGLLKCVGNKVGCRGRRKYRIFGLFLPDLIEIDAQ